MDQAIFEKVAKIIADKLNIDLASVKPEARFKEDLKADSLDLVDMIMEFEDQFGVKISDKDARDITTVGQVVEFLSGAVG